MSSLMHKPILSAFIWLLHLTCFAYGQEQQATVDADDGKKPAGRVAWFINTSMPDGLENPVSVLSGDDLVQITLSKRSHSAPVNIPKDGILKIVRKLDKPVAADQTPYLTLAQVLIPEGVGKALVILTPAAANPLGLVFDTKAQDLASFQGGDCMYLNMTNVKIGIDLGGEKTQVDPGETKIIRSKTREEPINLTIRYFFHHPKKEEWKILSSSTIALYPTRREICIFTLDPRFKRIDYHGITFPVM